MISGAHFVLYSSDAEADRAFLRDVLEFPFVDAGHEWLIFAVPPAELAVMVGVSEAVRSPLVAVTLPLVPPVALPPSALMVGVKAPDRALTPAGVRQVVIAAGYRVGLGRVNPPAPPHDRDGVAALKRAAGGDWAAAAASLGADDSI